MHLTNTRWSRIIRTENSKYKVNKNIKNEQQTTNNRQQTTKLQHAHTHTHTKSLVLKHHFLKVVYRGLGWWQWFLLDYWTRPSWIIILRNRSAASIPSTRCRTYYPLPSAWICNAHHVHTVQGWRRIDGFLGIDPGPVVLNVNKVKFVFCPPGWFVSRLLRTFLYACRKVHQCFRCSSTTSVTMRSDAMNQCVYGSFYVSFLIIYFCSSQVRH